MHGSDGRVFLEAESVGRRPVISTVICEYLMRLHPLQIPGGWNVLQNHFYDVTPAESVDGDRLDFPFVEDILQLTNEHLRMTLDLGWYPNENQAANYRLLLLQWTNHPRTAKCRSRLFA